MLMFPRDNTHPILTTLGSSHHQPRIQCVPLAALVHVGSPAQDLVDPQWDVGVDGYSVPLQGLGGGAQTLDLTAFHIPLGSINRPLISM